MTSGESHDIEGQSLKRSYSQPLFRAAEGVYECPFSLLHSDGIIFHRLFLFFRSPAVTKRAVGQNYIKKE